MCCCDDAIGVLAGVVANVAIPCPVVPDQACGQVRGHACPPGVVATVDDQTHFRRLLATGDLLQELLEPGLNLLDGARSTAVAQGVEQFGELHRDGDQARQRRLHPLNEIVADLLRQLLVLEESIDRFLLCLRQAA